MPDKVDADRNELSPTILAFYDEPANGTNGTSNNIASIPQILKATGMEKKDSDAVMGMIMDVSGARETVEDAMDTLNNLNFFGIENEVMGATEKMSTIYDQLEKSMSKSQSKELKARGFAFMSMDQINKVYRDSDNLNMPEEAMDFEDYSTLTSDQREEALWKRIEKIALNEPDMPVQKNATHRRVKRTGSLTVPSVLAPTVLAPFMFSPVFGLTVLGPTILSPNLFSPLILNPADFVAARLCAFYPYTLRIIAKCAQSIFAVTSDFKVEYGFGDQPSIWTKINSFDVESMARILLLLSTYLAGRQNRNIPILSPLVLCPDVISPMALGGAILSPSVASPAVFTETFLMANVLSPTFLSK
ncbi:Serum response factor-binding protein 1 [Aphelenchoides bicaudatus]|nr:Serum response factor-binding protein 1 [Aphelenchoides bicaudatus]